MPKYLAVDYLKIVS